MGHAPGAGRAERRGDTGGVIVRRPVGSCPGRSGPAARGAAAAPSVLRRLPVVVLAGLVALLSACSADPVPAPAPAPPPTTPITTPSRVVAGVDDIGAGFNPHLRAHQSPVTTAIATLALPSVFRPDSRGALQLDPTVATSATVTSTAPFTVSYELNVAASWSSGAPIAAEDFVYLWQQMRTQPGTIGAAGYRAVSDVRSRAGGKAVDVVFDKPYPHWRELFSGLLPAHILKDAPGGWTGPLTNGVPASGGPFRVMSVDRIRGEVLMTRSDPYWATPSVVDEIVLRRLDPAVLPTALSNHDVDLALPDARPDITRALATLSTPPTVQRGPRPLVQQLALRTGGGALADPRVRQGIAATLNREAIRAAVAPEAVPVDSFGAAPSDPGYVASAPAGAPARPDPAAAAAAFGQAGYVRGANGAWQLGGRPLNVVVGAAAERPEDVRVAQAVASQLRAGGVTATVVAPPAADLFSRPTVAPVAHTTTPTRAPGGAGPAPRTGDAPAPAPSASPTRSAAPSSGASPTSTAPAGPVAVDVLVAPRAVTGAVGPRLDSAYGCPAPGVPADSPASSCFPALQPLFDQLRTGPADPATVAEAERILWTQLPALPLYQPQGLVVSTPATDAATRVTPGPLSTGPLTGAQRWAEPERPDR